MAFTTFCLDVSQISSAYYSCMLGPSADHQYAMHKKRGVISCVFDSYQYGPALSSRCKCWNESRSTLVLQCQCTLTELGLKCFTALLKLLLVLNEHNSQDFNHMLHSVWLILRYTSFLMTQSCQLTAFSWHTDDTVFHLPGHYSSHGLAGAWGGGHLGVSCRLWHQLAWRRLHCQTAFLVWRCCAVRCATLVRYVCSTVVAAAACLT